MLRHYNGSNVLRGCAIDFAEMGRSGAAPLLGRTGCALGL